MIDRAVICTLLALCVSGQIYISPSGNDLASCTVTDPCQSLQRALSGPLVSPLVIFMDTGSYSGSKNCGLTIPGNVTATIQSWHASETVVLNATESRPILRASNSLTLQGLTLDASDAFAVVMSGDVAQFTVTSCQIYAGIQFLGHIDHLRLQSSETHANLLVVQVETAEMVDSVFRGGLIETANHLSVERCSFMNTSNALQLEGTSSLLFTENFVETTGSSYFKTEAAMTIANSSFVGNGLKAIDIASYMGISLTIFVHNVTIEGDYLSGLSIDGGSGATLEVSDTMVSAENLCLSLDSLISLNASSSVFTMCSTLVGTVASGARHEFNVTFDDCEFVGTGGFYIDPVSGYWPTNGTIRNSIFQDTTLPAVKVSDSHSWYLINNTFVVTGAVDEENTNTFVLINGTALLVERCSFHGNGLVESAIVVDENYTVSKLDVVMCEFRGMKDAGVFIQTTPTIVAEISACNFEQNGAGVMYTASSDSHLKIIDSHFADTTNLDGAAVGLAGPAWVVQSYFITNRQGIATHTSDPVKISQCVFTDHTNSAIWFTPGDSQGSATVGIDMLDFTDCAPWAIDCEGDITIEQDCYSDMCGPWYNELHFDSGDATSNINTNTCRLSPAYKSRFAGWYTALFLLVVLGCFFLCLVAGAVALFSLLRSKHRERQVDYVLEDAEQHL